MKKCTEVAMAWLVTCLLWCGQVAGQGTLAARFDSFNECYSEQTITEGGVTFKNLDRYPPPGEFL